MDQMTEKWLNEHDDRGMGSIKKCSYCGKSFVVRAANQYGVHKYCSQKCGNAATYQKTIAFYVCDFCGKQCKRSRDSVKRSIKAGRGIYCSIECAKLCRVYSSMKEYEKTKKEWIENNPKKCEYCGKNISGEKLWRSGRCNISVEYCNKRCCSLASRLNVHTISEEDCLKQYRKIVYMIQKLFKITAFNPLSKKSKSKQYEMFLEKKNLLYCKDSRGVHILFKPVLKAKKNGQRVHKRKKEWVGK